MFNNVSDSLFGFSIEWKLSEMGSCERDSETKIKW